METIKQYTIESCPPYIECERISLLQNKNGVLFVKIEERYDGDHIFPIDEIKGIYVKPGLGPSHPSEVHLYTGLKPFIYKFTNEQSEIMYSLYAFLYKLLDLKTK